MAKEFKKGSKEFEEARDSFERSVKSLHIRILGTDPLMRSGRHEESFYENGDANDLFKVFLAGYMAGKSFHR